MTIHYHGLPITPNSAAAKLRGKHFLVSFAYPGQVEIAAEVGQSFVADSGAYTSWMQGKPITDWKPYLSWVGELMRYPNFDWALIPDHISSDGDNTKENDRLVREWPYKNFGVPVFHMHEPLARLGWLMREFPRVALGSSGEWPDPGTHSWWQRMAQIMEYACDKDGYPRTKFHGLRMMSPRILESLCLSSADSSTVGRNIGLDKHWAGPNEPPTKEWRALVYAERLESVNAPARWAGIPMQRDLFGREVA